VQIHKLIKGTLSAKGLGFILTLTPILMLLSHLVSDPVCPIFHLSKNYLGVEKVEWQSWQFFNCISQH